MPGPGVEWSCMKLWESTSSTSRPAKVTSLPLHCPQKASIQAPAKMAEWKPRSHTSRRSIDINPGGHYGEVIEKPICLSFDWWSVFAFAASRSAVLQTLLSSDDNQDIPSSNPINQISSRNLLVFRQLRPASSRLHFLNLPQSTVILNFHTSFVPLSHCHFTRMPMLCENFVTFVRKATCGGRERYSPDRKELNPDPLPGLLRGLEGGGRSALSALSLVSTSTSDSKSTSSSTSTASTTTAGSRRRKLHRMLTTPHFYFLISHKLSSDRLTSCWPTEDWNAGRCSLGGGAQVEDNLPPTSCSSYHTAPHCHTLPHTTPSYSYCRTTLELGHVRHHRRCHCSFFAHHVWPPCCCCRPHQQAEESGTFLAA